MTPLDWIDSGDVCSLVGFIAILGCAGTNMVANYPSARTWGWRCAAAAFILYIVTGSRLQPTGVQDWFIISLRALLAGAFTLVVAWITLAIITFIIQFIPKPKPKLPPLPIPQPPQERQESVPQPSPPPPPTPEERAATALQRYESRLQLIANAELDETERQAARDRAKQQYLRELDETMR